MTDLMKAALETGAAVSARYWKQRLALETDPVWQQIGLQVAVEDAVSIAAGKLGVDIWDDTSWDIEGRRVDVFVEAYDALKVALNKTSLFSVGDRFVDADGCCARVIDVEHFDGWDRVTVAFPGHNVSGTAEFIAKTLARDGFGAEG